jgi:hypothetical protein
MQLQDVKNIEGFENGKGEKLDIKKNKTIPQDALFNANNTKSVGSSSFIKILGYLSLICAIAFIPVTLHVNELFWIGTAVCFSMFVFCFIFSSIIDNVAGKNSEFSFAESNTDNNLSCVAQNQFLSANNEKKNTNINSQVKYDKNSYYKTKDSANIGQKY